MDALPNEGLVKLAGWKESSVHEREEGIAPAILVGMIWSWGGERRFTDCHGGQDPSGCSVYLRQILLA